MSHLMKKLLLALLISVGFGSAAQAQFADAQTFCPASCVGGTANAITLAVPQFNPYQQGVPLRFYPASANTGDTTIAVSGGTVTHVRKLTPGGPVVLVGGELQPNQYATVIWDGTYFELTGTGGLVNASPITGSYKNLVIKNDAGTPNSILDITADQFVIGNSTGQSFKGLSISVTVSTGLSGPGGIDTGTVAINTGYYVYLIYNPGTATWNGLLSTSSTSPTLPAGYSYSRRVSWNVTDGSSLLKRITQTNDHGRYIVTAATNTANLPIASSGTAGSITVPTWVSVSLSNLVPATAIAVTGSVTTNPGATAAICRAMVAPNNAYGASTSTSNPPPVVSSSASSVASSTETFTFELESLVWFWANANCAGGLTAVYGWRDNI